MRRILVSALVLLLLPISSVCHAQRFSVSTNLLGYVALGTMNVEGSYSLSRRMSLTAGAVYNPFTFGRDVPEKQIQLRQQSYSVGLRIWPWHTWSGWWFAGKGRWQEYNFGGIPSQKTDEGDRYGFGLYAGYTHMLAPHFNIEFGVGFWGGLDVYHRYSCPVCGLLMSTGKRLFVLPDDLMISIAYVF